MRRNRCSTLACSWVLATATAFAFGGESSGTPPELRTSRSATLDLEKGFRQPPNEAKPRVYWWWLNSQVTEAAITRDLEEMKAKGIGGALLFDAGGGENVPAGPAFMSDPWRALFRHAVREADRLGLELSVNLCSGWDCGGPWITPQYACRRVAFEKTVVTGPQSFAKRLPVPAREDYRDVALLALPVSDDYRRLPRPTVTASSSQRRYPVAHVFDSSCGSFWVSDGWKAGEGPTAEKPEWLSFDFPSPVSLSLTEIFPRQGFGPHRVAVQVGEDGKTFRTVAEHVFADSSGLLSVVIRFPEVTTQHVRLLITSSYSFDSTDSPWNVQISEVSFEESSLWADWTFKAAVGPIPYASDYPPKHGQSYVAPMEDTSEGQTIGAVAGDTVINLADKVDAAGELRWDVPKGRWVVLRMGHVAAGYRTRCSSAGGRGLEVDWLGAPAMDFHFAATAEKLLQDAGPLAGRTLKYFHDDSWEVGVPNWTDGFRKTFRENRGYDPTPYLPVLAGQVVDSKAISERFLYDYRKTIADCMADDHYGRFRELCHCHGVLMHTEGGGPCTQIGIMDALRNLGQNDVPMGEFWHSPTWIDQNRQNAAGKQTACAAHVYGKRFVAAEAFTSWFHWQHGPADLKPTVDIAFCEGINRCFWHTFTCSPQEFGTPGIEYFAGTHLNPNLTWWDQSAAFLSYLARCQFLLSQGLFVADVCYDYGDHAPNFVVPKHVDPALGPGYDYDVCNADVVLNRMRVKDGKIVLPDGMSYRLLVLPPRQTMPLEVLQKLRQLVAAGATVVGPKPQRAPGLRDYPRQDEQVRQLADELWGACDGEQITEYVHGHGRVIWGRALRDVLQEDGVDPDFEYSNAEADGDVLLDYIHRSLDGGDVYFVANRGDRPERVDCSFRVSGRQPELWNPVSGKTREAKAFRQVDGRTMVPLKFAPHGSMFVVFRKSIDGDVVGPDQCNWQAEATSDELTGPWTVRFDPKWGGPASVTFEQLVDWATRPEPSIRYYSGAATYAKEFDVPQALRRDGQRIELDLGTVHNIAEVRLNGKDLGTIWTAPWRVDISNDVKPAANLLEITVVNLWPNRLIGDASLPSEERLSRTNVTKYEKDSPLLPSGLLGPVTLRAVRAIGHE